MSHQSISVNILSDSDSDEIDLHNDVVSKRQRTDPILNPPAAAVLLVDDYPTPPAPKPKPSGLPPDNKFSVICLESDNDESDDMSSSTLQNAMLLTNSEVELISESLGNSNKTHFFVDGYLDPFDSQNDIPQELDLFDKDMDEMQPVTADLLRSKSDSKEANKEKNIDPWGKQRTSKEEKLRLKEEKRLQKEQEKLQKAALKAEALEMKKVQKEKQKWEKGKLGLTSIVAEIDTKVVELGLIGGNLLTRFADKGIKYRITSNPIERSIVWSMTVPKEDSQLSSCGIEIPYVLLVYEADEFCDLVNNEGLMDHVSCVQRHYPTHTVCYLTNKLMSYINKREQGHYKDPTKYSGWKCPPVQEVLSKLTVQFSKVHSRQCTDEAELAEHVVGLTCSLASCQFRKKLTWLSVNATASIFPKDCADKTLIKKNLWLKALVAIPKVQPRFAIAIGKKYPTMKSLLRIYMDPSKSVHEKEFLLTDLTIEVVLGDTRRLGEICSKRVYRILMAQYGNVKADDVEDGAGFFQSQSP